MEQHYIDSSKLPDIKINPAIPSIKNGNELPHDIFGTFSFFDKSLIVTDSAGNFIYDETYVNHNWQNNLSSRNFLIQKYLSGKPVIVETERLSIVKKVLPQPRIIQETYGLGNFVIGILLVCFILIAWLKYNFSKYLQQISHSIVNYSESAKLFHDHNALIDRVYFILNLVFVFTGGLLLFHLFRHFQPDNTASPYYQYLVSCVIVTAFLFYRIILSKVSGYILNQRSGFDEYNHSNLLYFKATGIVLLPLTAIISFINSNFSLVLLYSCIILIILFYSVSIFRGTRIILQKGVLLFYWILYLCTIEFIPILLLIQYVRNSILKL